MAVDSVGGTRDVVEDYRALADARVDELVSADPLSGIQAEVADTLRSVGPMGLTGWAERVRSFIADEGISYGIRRRGETARNWSLDPIPLLLSSPEWDRLEAGLAQRAVLLDAVLGDIYGERRLVQRGLLPAETFLGHAGFLHQATSIRLPGPRQLVLAAADLARDDTGAWRLLGDRAQAPSGAAYAMANRRIIARVLPTLHRRTDLARLRGFFDTMRQALQAAAPTGVDVPRVVVLSPGPLSETAYDQALTATLLGFPLVESDDLTARDGQVWLRTTGGLERVDVLLRRVDADWCDNLELRPESRLGVPGLVEAARLGACSVVNPLGAAVLENVALLPYLASVCRAVTGEDLLLRPAQTWWCGDATQRSHVLANLDRLVIKATSRGVGPASRFGWELGADEPPCCGHGSTRSRGPGRPRSRSRCRPHLWSTTANSNPVGWSCGPSGWPTATATPSCPAAWRGWQPNRTRRWSPASRVPRPRTCGCWPTVTRSDGPRGLLGGGMRSPGDAAGHLARPRGDRPRGDSRGGRGRRRHPAGCRGLLLAGPLPGAGRGHSPAVAGRSRLGRGPRPASRNPGRYDAGRGAARTGRGDHGSAERRRAARG